jgi:uncharacterized protein involved in cysteine biosynthesis
VTWLNSLPEWAQAMVLVLGIFAAIGIAMFFTWDEPKDDDDDDLNF